MIFFNARAETQGRGEDDEKILCAPASLRDEFFSFEAPCV